MYIWNIIMYLNVFVVYIWNCSNYVPCDFVTTQWQIAKSLGLSISINLASQYIIWQRNLKSRIRSLCYQCGECEKIEHNFLHGFLSASLDSFSTVRLPSIAILNSTVIIYHLKGERHFLLLFYLAFTNTQIWTLKCCEIWNFLSVMPVFKMFHVLEHFGFQICRLEMVNW
jgi:hypothetical protein